MGRRRPAAAACWATALQPPAQGPGPQVGACGGRGPCRCAQQRVQRVRPRVCLSQSPALQRQCPGGREEGGGLHGAVAGAMQRGGDAQHQAPGSPEPIASWEASCEIAVCLAADDLAGIDDRHWSVVMQSNLSLRRARLAWGVAQFCGWKLAKKWTTDRPLGQAQLRITCTLSIYESDHIASGSPTNPAGEWLDHNTPQLSGSGFTAGDGAEHNVTWSPSHAEVLRPRPAPRPAMPLITRNSNAEWVATAWCFLQLAAGAGARHRAHQQLGRSRPLPGCTAGLWRHRFCVAADARSLWPRRMQPTSQQLQTAP